MASEKELKEKEKEIEAREKAVAEKEKLLNAKPSSPSREKIPARYLKGLKFRTNEMREVEEDGEKKERPVSVVRQLRPEDVLDWADKGDVVVIATADGRKYRVEKEA